MEIVQEFASAELQRLPTDAFYFKLSRLTFTGQEELVHLTPSSFNALILHAEVTPKVFMLVKPKHQAKSDVGRGQRLVNSTGGGRLPIHVKLIDGQTQTFQMQSYDRVEQLAEAVALSQGIGADVVRLISKGRQLEADKTLSDYNIQSGDTVHFVKRLTGKTYRLFR